MQFTEIEDTLIFSYPWYFGAGFGAVFILLGVIAVCWFMRIKRQRKPSDALLWPSLMLTGAFIGLCVPVYFFAYKLEITPKAISIFPVSFSVSTLNWSDVARIKYVHTESTDFRGRTIITEEFLLLSDFEKRLRVIVVDYPHTDFSLLVKRFASYAPESALDGGSVAWLEWIVARPWVEDDEEEEPWNQGPVPEA